MFIGLFSIISLCYCGSIRVPLQRIHGNVPSVTIGIDENVPHTFDLVISNVSRIPSSSDENDVLVHLPGLQIFNVSIFNVSMHRSSSMQSSLGIGPRSAFLNRFGSAGICANELVLNMTQSDFVSRCVPGTNFTIPPLNTFRDTYYVGAGSIRTDSHGAHTRSDCSRGSF